MMEDEELGRMKREAQYLEFEEYLLSKGYAASASVVADRDRPDHDFRWMDIECCLRWAEYFNHGIEELILESITSTDKNGENHVAELKLGLDQSGYFVRQLTMCHKDEYGIDHSRLAFNFKRREDLPEMAVVNRRSEDMYAAMMAIPGEFKSVFNEINSAGFVVRHVMDRFQNRFHAEDIFLYQNAHLFEKGMDNVFPVVVIAASKMDWADSLCYEFRVGRIGEKLEINSIDVVKYKLSGSVDMSKRIEVDPKRRLPCAKELKDLLLKNDHAQRVWRRRL